MPFFAEGLYSTVAPYSLSAKFVHSEGLQPYAAKQRSLRVGYTGNLRRIFTDNLDIRVRSVLGILIRLVREIGLLVEVIQRNQQRLWMCLHGFYAMMGA